MRSRMLCIRIAPLGPRKYASVFSRPLATLPDRLMAGRLVLVQVIGVRIPVREPHKTDSFC